LLGEVAKADALDASANHPAARGALARWGRHAQNWPDAEWFPLLVPV
jgi:hypothetical protein